MRSIYSFGISTYWAAIGLASLFSAKAKDWMQGRKDIFKRLEKALSQQKNIVWFHCASLGEFEQGRPIIEAYRRNYPNDKILLSFFSPSGYRIRKNYEGADYVFYLPIDTQENAKRFVSLVNPKMVFFIKYEFWFNYLNEIGKKNIPCFLISGIFREDQLFFKSYGKWTLKQLSNFSHFFLQNSRSAELLEKHGYSNFSITGDTRFDRVVAIADKAKEIPEVGRFCKESFTVVFGSSWPEEDAMAVDLMENDHFHGKIIIAPHEVNEEKIKSLSTAFAGQSVLWSELEQQQKDMNHHRVLIIDTIGLLSSIYRYGDVAVIGGGFGKGVHNVLEAATFGLPIYIGPNYQKFQEVKDLVELGAAKSVNSKSEFIDNFMQVYQNDELLMKKSQLAKEYVQGNAGATEKIMEYLVRSS